MVAGSTVSASERSAAAIRVRGTAISRFFGRFRLLAFDETETEANLDFLGDSKR